MVIIWPPRRVIVNSRWVGDFHLLKAFIIIDTFSHRHLGGGGVAEGAPPVRNAVATSPGAGKFCIRVGDPGAQGLGPSTFGRESPEVRIAPLQTEPCRRRRGLRPRAQGPAEASFAGRGEGQYRGLASEPGRVAGFGSSSAGVSPMPWGGRQLPVSRARFLAWCL